MNVLRPLLAIAALAAASAAAADRTLDVPVPGAHGVDVAIPMRLRIVEGTPESLKLEGDEELVSRAEVRVEDGLVRILSRDRGGFDWNGKLQGVLTLARVDTVALGGAGRIEAARLQGDSIRATISGAGNLHVGRLEAKEAKLHISGTGILDVAEGRAARVAATISGTGNVRAARLEVQEATARISGAGHATLWVRDALDAQVSGVGKITYYGDPRVESRTSGVGSVSRLGAAPG